MSNESEYVLVPRAAIEHIAKHYPTLMHTSGLTGHVFDPPQKMIDEIDFGPEPEEEQG